MIKIRKLTEKDYQSFRDLRQLHLDSDPQSVSTTASAWQEAPKEKVLALLKFEGIEADEFILGAFSSNTLVGMLGFKRELRKHSTMHKGMFWGFFVNKLNRDKGIGTMLLERALLIAKEFEWCEMIRVMITTTDEAAIHLAEKTGFARYGLEHKSLKMGSQYHDYYYYNIYFD